MGRRLFKLTAQKVAIVLVVLGLVTYSYCVFSLTHFASYSKSSDRQKGVVAIDNALKAKIKDLSLRYRVDWDCRLNTTEEVTWKLAESWMTSRFITPHGQQLGCVLSLLNTAPIIHADVGVKGTQLKIVLTLSGGQRVVFKPKVYDVDYLMVGTPYAGRDRYNAEIAAFHLNRIVGLNKVPLVVGRTLNLDREIKPVAHKNLLQTFYNQNGNTCFYGRCYYCKGKETGVCAHDYLLHGSVTMWLPESYALSQPLPHPWRRTYKANQSAPWENNPKYCLSVRDTRPYESGPRMLDLIDVAIFDFLISNADRHHYETFEYSKDSIVVALDNGKAFGNPYVDELSILAPLYQCCYLRKSTYATLRELTDGILGSVLREVLRKEPLHPLLQDRHFSAVDRRLSKVLTVVKNCTDLLGSDKVLLSDGYE